MCNRFQSGTRLPGYRLCEIFFFLERNKVKRKYNSRALITSYRLYYEVFTKRSSSNIPA